jgi:tetratricopeptide (TPR) repeat protein
MRAHWATALGCGLWLLCAPAAAAPRLLTVEGLDAQELGRLAAHLADADEARRDAAYRTLRELHGESLPGIEARLAALRRQHLDSDVAKAALSTFRRALGSRRGDDGLDIAPGVAKVLASPEARVPATLRMAEAVLLLRAIEHIAGRAVAPALASMFTLDEPGVWDTELGLARRRAGLALLPALITLRSHEDPRVRAFAQSGIRALDMDDPALATNVSDAHLAAEIVRAYTEPLDFQAMPAVVRLVNADKQELRDAARLAVQRYGKNAIWQLRQLYSEVTGTSPDRRWDTERTAQALYAALDSATTKEADALLAKGLAYETAGKLDPMQRSFDQMLARFPRYPGRAKLAPGYAALGQSFLARDQLGAARDAYQRALRLAPDAPEAEARRAQLAFIDAEIGESHGVVDLHGYDEALQHEPEMEVARAAKDRLTGARAARERRNKRLAAGAAIVLLMMTGAMLLRGRSLPEVASPTAS